VYQSYLARFDSNRGRNQRCRPRPGPRQACKLRCIHIVPPIMGSQSNITRTLMYSLPPGCLITGWYDSPRPPAGRFPSFQSYSMQERYPCPFPLLLYPSRYSYLTQGNHTNQDKATPVPVEGSYSPYYRIPYTALVPQHYSVNPRYAHTVYLSIPFLALTRFLRHLSRVPSIDTVRCSKLTIPSSLHP
jgi:hypothetical protein